MDADKKIVEFLKASSEVEKYLHGDGPLTPLQYQTIDTTIMGLRTLLESWRRKNGPADDSLLSEITARKAQGF